MCLGRTGRGSVDRASETVDIGTVRSVPLAIDGAVDPADIGKVAQPRFVDCGLTLDVERDAELRLVAKNGLAYHRGVQMGSGLDRD